MKYTRKKETKERRDCSDWRNAEAMYGSINVSLRLVRVTIFCRGRAIINKYSECVSVSLP
jgi:hypothetical protein